MLHARIVQPPAIGARLRDVDETSIALIPQAKLIRVRDFLAVVAPHEWDAVRALRALQATWSGDFIQADLAQHRPTLCDPEHAREHQVARNDATATFQFASARQDRQMSLRSRASSTSLRRPQQVSILWRTGCATFVIHAATRCWSVSGR